MTVVDTSIWVRFFRTGDDDLAALLEGGAVTMHDFVLGELACGNLQRREITLSDLHQLPRVRSATTDEVLFLIETHSLQGRGLGWVDMHLLAACRAEQLKLYTRDGALMKAANALGIAYRR